MRIVEKKCPNCGANLSFESDAKEAKCNYCSQEYIIEQDKNVSEKNETSPDDFKLEKKAIKAFNFVRFFIFFIVILAFIGIFVFAYKQIKSNNIFGTQKIEIKNIDESTLKLIHNATLDKLKLYNTFYNIEDYEYVGIYLYKDDFGYKLNDVYKVILKTKEKNIEIYETVKYRNVNIKNNKVSLNYDGMVETNMVSIDNMYLMGFRSLEELYNKVIFSNSSSNIQATDGLYLNN